MPQNPSQQRRRKLRIAKRKARVTLARDFRRATGKRIAESISSFKSTIPRVIAEPFRIKWDKLVADIGAFNERQQPGRAKLIEGGFNSLRLLFKRYPTAMKMGMLAGLGLVAYGITTRLAGGATVPKIGEGYHELNMGMKYREHSRNLRDRYTDFGSKVRLTDDRPSLTIAEDMLEGKSPAMQTYRDSLNASSMAKGLNYPSQKASITLPTNTRNRSLPRHPEPPLADQAMKRKVRSLSLAIDARKNGMFRTSKIAGKGHRIRNTDHARAMNQILNG